MGGEQAFPRAQDRLAAVRGEGAGRDPRQARLQGQEGQVRRRRNRGRRQTAGWLVEIVILVIFCHIHVHIHYPLYIISLV